MQKNKICKICGVEESEDIVFHTHHITPKNKGGSNKKNNLVDICNDCHYDIHYPGSVDTNLEQLEEVYKDALSVNIFSDGYGILPNRICHDQKLSSFSKLLYCDISSLCAQKGYCWASNKYFANIFNVSEKTISRALTELEPFLIIRNRLSSTRMIWVHNLENVIKPKKEKNKKVLNKLIKKASPVKKKNLYSPDDLSLAETLLSKILYNFPALENKKVNISEWAEEMRKLREIDKASKEQINFMIIWVQGGELNIPGKPIKNFAPHDFWSKNILSAKKLRKQWFENLVPQLQEEMKKIAKKNTPTQL